MVGFIAWHFAITVILINGVGIMLVILFVVFYQLNRDYKRRQLRKLQQRFRRFWCGLIKGDLASRGETSFSIDDLILLLPFCLKRKNQPDFNSLIECLRAVGIINTLVARLHTAKSKEKLIYLDLLFYLNYEHLDQLFLELLQVPPPANLTRQVQEPQTMDVAPVKDNALVSHGRTKLNDNSSRFDRSYWLLKTSMGTKQFKTARRLRPRFYNTQYTGKLQFQNHQKTHFNTVICSNKRLSDEKNNFKFLDINKVVRYHRPGKNNAYIFD